MARLQDTADNLADPLGAVGAEVVADAQHLARRRTGALASSVHLERRARSVSVASGLAYSGVQNYGWRRHNISASYFLNNAANTKGDRAADLVAAEITQQIRSAGLA